jgi:Flp pilus assembly protein TadG
MTRIATLLRRTTLGARREDGNASIEFALLFPLFITIFISSIESGLMALRYVSLERGVDIAVRELRLGLARDFADMTPDAAHTVLKQRICSSTMLVPNCEQVLFLELINVNPDVWNIPDATAQCVDRTNRVAPKLNFNAGVANEMMIVRACAIVDPLIPDFGLGAEFLKDDQGRGVALIAASAFVNEPDR